MAEPARYERRDLSVRGVVIAAIVIVAGFTAAMLLAALVDYLGQGVPGPRQPLAWQAPPVPPPRLQINPQGDLREFLLPRLARLRSYGWVDREAGIVHIPIEQAMRLVEERGLPRWQAPADAPGLAAYRARQQALEQEESLP